MLAGFRGFMQPNHPAWGAVREAARRLLRSDRIELHLPYDCVEQGVRLINHIMENNPRQVDIPTVREDDEPSIQSDGRLLVSWSDGRSLGTLLFPAEGAFAATMPHVLTMAHDLVEAGYPGCLGCGGPGIEDDWSEVKWRSLH
jgi:hypothetical protein